MGFDLTEARKHYSDDEILSYLDPDQSFDVEAAIKSGYTMDEILNHLASKPEIPEYLETPPGRFLSGLGRSAKATIEGIIGLPAFARKAASQPIYRTVDDIVQGIKKFPATVAEEYKRDPWEAAGKTVGDIAQLAAGFGMGKGGVTLGRAGKPLPTGPIPGAAQFAMEGEGTALGATSRMFSRSPIGAGPTARATTGRAVGINLEAQRLLGGPVLKPEATGLRTTGAIKSNLAKVEGIEGAMWDELRAVTKQLDVRPNLTNTIERIDPILKQSEEAYNLITSNISPAAEKALAKIGMQKEAANQGFLLAARGKAAKGKITASELLNSVPPSQRNKVLQRMKEVLGDDNIAELPSFEAMREARTEIGRLLFNEEKKAALGNRTTGALNQVYAGLTEDLEAALARYPELQSKFKQASEFTKGKHELFGTPGTLTYDVLKKTRPTVPSKVVPELMRGSIESARNYMKSIGDDVVARKEVARSVMGQLFDDASMGQFGKSPQALIDGPAFAKAYRKYRPVIEELVDEDLLKSWDTFADQMRKYDMTRGAAGTTEGIAGRIASLAEFGTAIGGVTGSIAALFAGDPFLAAQIAGGAAVPLLTARILVNLMLQPKGPHLLARFLHTGKWTPALGRALEAATYGTTALRGPAAEAKREEEERKRQTGITPPPSMVGE